MDEETWLAVDEFLAGLVAGEDDALRTAVERSAAEGLPAIQVSALQGKLLMLLVRIQAARRILEIGTLGGYSAIWMARALPPGGRLISLELDPHHAAVARKNLEGAGVTDRVEVRVGKAADTLASLAAEGAEPFDFIFIDADKPSNPEYLLWALRLSRPGTIIIGDNVVRSGRITDSASDDPTIRSTRRFHEMLGNESKVEATVIQTVGSKGYDGFALAVVGGDAQVV